MLNPRLDDLPGYPFTRLARLLEGIEPPADREPILMSLGEPRHAPPPFVRETLDAHAADWGRYPPLGGTPGFRRAVADWLRMRFKLPEGFIDADAGVLPVAGTREALFMFALVAANAPGADGKARPKVLVPNPLYHVYAGAAAMAGAEPVFVAATRETGFLPDYAALAPEVLDRTSLAYLCTPANPQGAAADLERLKALLGLAIKHDFIVAVDECYSEIYYAAPPAGILQAAAAMGARANAALERVVAFNSLSKRSSAPGLRSGFVAGGADLIAAFARLRNFASVQSPLPVIAAAERLWRDEDHVAASRERYRAKLSAAEDALEGAFGYTRPDGGFFLWLDVGDGEAAALRLWAEAGLRALPGAYLCPETAGDEAPGARYLRLALVDEPDIVREAIGRVRRVLEPARAPKEHSP